MVFGFHQDNKTTSKSSGLSKKSFQGRKTNAAKSRNRKLLFEGLEDRRVLALVATAFPPPGGVNFSASGDAGFAGGRTFSFDFSSNPYVIPGANNTNLYWGPSSASMSMAGPANQQSFTTGDITSGPFSTTVWTRNNLLMDTVIPGPTLVTGQLVLNAPGLTIPPPGLPTNIGAALPVTGNFSANFTFYANGTPYKQYYNALSTGGAGTVGSFQGQFWYENSPTFSASSLTAGLSNNGIADTFLISKVGSDTVLTINGLTAYRFPTANLSAITINGSNDQDTLTIDYTNGNPLPASGVNFNGGSGFDTLSFIGGGSFANITHNFSNANDGSVNIDGTVVSYTGLDPVIDNLNAATRSFIFNGGTETITLADSGTPGQTLISSTLGESVTFVNPTTSLTVNPGSGVDTVNVTGLGSGFSASLNILGTVASGLATLGSFAYTNNGVNQPGDSLDVNPNGEVVYIGGSFGPSYAAYRRVQASNPSAMFSDLSAFGQGGGIAVNPVTGRFAVTNGSSLLTIYNPDGTVYDTKPLAGLGGSIAAGNGTFGISTQGTDSFHLYNEAAKTLQVFGGLAVGSRVTYNPGTGFYYMNRTPGQTFFVNEASPATNGLLASQIFFEAANGVTNRLYAVNSNNVNIYNAAVPSSPPLLGTIAGLPAAVQDVAVNTVRDRLYIGLQGTNQILIYSGNGATPLGVYTLPAGNSVQKLDIAPGSDRLYVTAVAGGTNSNLFVLSESGSTINITGATSTSAAVLISGNSVNVNANLSSGGNVLVTSENITFGNGTLSTGAGNSATLNVANGSILSGVAANDVVAGSISLTAGFGGIGASGNPLTLSGTNLNTSTTGNGNQFLSTSGAISIDATGLSAGTGTIQLDAGTFNLGGSNRINDNSKLNVNSATFAIGNNSETIDTLTLTSGSVTGSAGVLTSTNTIQTKTGSISASLAGTNGLTQSTSGTTTLTGTNSYTGTTNINAGTLLVNGTNSGTGPVSVNNTGTLGGSGSIGGTVTAASGSIVAPGSSAAVGTIGTLTVGGLILNSGSTLQADLTNTPTSDRIIVTGSTLTLTNPTITPTAPGNLTNSSNQNFRIIQSGTAATGTFNGFPEGSQVAVSGSSVPTYITYQGGTSSLPGTNVDLNTQPTVNGTSGADTLVFNTTATGYTYSLNGGAAVAVNANIPFIFNGGDGDDVMRVNLNTFALPTAGVFFNGNNQDLTVGAPTPNHGDVLKVVGNGANVEYRAFGTPGTTNKNLNVNTSVGLITATGVEPGDLSGFATVDVVFSGADEVLSIDNGFDATTGLIQALVVTGTTGGNPFEGAHLWNNATVRILTANTSIGGTDGNDSVVINSASNAHNNTNLVIDTGSGTDSVTVAGNATVSGSITILSQNISFTGGVASATAVVLNAGTGAITNTTTPAVDVSATQLTAQATTGIDLDTTVTNIQLTNSGAASVNIDETDALNLLGVNVGGSLTIVAGGALTDDTSANTQVTGNANLTASSILLGDSVSDAVNFGSLTFTSTGSVTITENSFTNLAGSSSGTAVSLTSTGGIVDGAAATDITASTSLIFVASLGVGVGNAVETATPNLEAQTAAGGLFIDNTGDLTIGGISGLTGLFSNTSPIILNNAGSLNVSENVVAQFDFLTLRTIDSAVGNQDITVNALVSSGLAVTLLSGDDLLVNAPITAGTTVTGNVDSGNADGGTGGVFTLAGSVGVPVAITAPGGTFLNGNTDNDTFNVYAQTTTAFSIDGDLPVGTLTGDILSMNVTGTGATLTVGGTAPYNGAGSGTWTFAPSLQSIRFKSIEDSQITGSYHLTYDFANSAPVTTDLFVMRDATTAKLQLRDGSNAGPILFQANLAPNLAGNGVLSLNVLGTGNNESVTVDDINTLPVFAAAVPGTPDNAILAGQASLLFQGAGGTNKLNFALTGANISQTYAIGNGAGVGSEGEVQTVAGAGTLTSYFTGLGPAGSVNRTGGNANPGSLTILGDNLGNTINVTGAAAVTNVDPTGYTPFNYSASGGTHSYSALNLFGLDGNDTLNLQGFGSSVANDPTITLDGGNNDDILQVGSTSGNLGAISILGQAGNDTTRLYTDGLNPSGANRSDLINGKVTVDGGAAGGNDQLFLVALANTSALTNVQITSTTIDNVTPAASTDVTFSNINLLDVTTTNLADTITTTLTAPSVNNDLAVVNVHGGDSSDQFYLHIPATPTNTPAGLTNINLLGDAGDDFFGSNADRIIPAYSKASGANIFINGGTPDLPAFDPVSKNSIDGDKLTGDRIYLDMSSATAPVIVDTVTGFADSASHRRLVYNGIEDIDLYDNAGQLQNVHQGSLYMRATEGSDYLVLMGLTGGKVRIRANNGYYGDYAPVTKLVVHARGGNDYIATSVMPANLPLELYGDEGDDSITGSAAGDLIVGGEGLDRLSGGAGGIDEMWGDVFNPITANPNLDIMLDPTNVLAISIRASQVDKSTFSSLGGPAANPSTDGNDIITTSAGNGADRIYGQGGNDIVTASAQDDVIYGGDGIDNLSGANGNDRIYGNAGNDNLAGEGGDDFLFGGDGNDTLNGGLGNDVLVGGFGQDILRGDQNRDMVIGGTISYSGINSGTADSKAYGDSNDVAMLELLNNWRLAVAPSIPFAGLTALPDGEIDSLSGGDSADDFYNEAVDLLIDYLPATGDRKTF